MPAKSKAQNRYVRAAAARGEKWAQRWVREQHGKKVPNRERVKKKRRPKRGSLQSVMGRRY